MSRNPDDLISAMKRRLSDLGRGDEELSRILTLLADIQLVQLQLSPDPIPQDYPVQTEEQLRHDRRKETPLQEWDAPADRETEELIRRVEQVATARQALADAGLTREEFQCLVLTGKHGLTHADVAEAMNVSVPTVERRLREARRKLGEALSEPPDRTSPGAASTVPVCAV